MSLIIITLLIFLVFSWRTVKNAENFYWIYYCCGWKIMINRGFYVARIGQEKCLYFGLDQEKHPKYYKN